MRQPTLHTNSGVVLFMVLILTVIMFLVAGALLIITMTEIRLSDFEYRSTQAFYAAESAIALGIARLRQNSEYRGDYAPIYYNIGRNPGELEITTRERPPARYHFLLCGTGRIPGWQAAATRTVEREVTMKPFVIFAEQQLTLTGQCNIAGHVHGNTAVTVGPSVTINGNVTSSATPVLNQGTIGGEHISSEFDLLEPEIGFPELIMTTYNWTYPCVGTEGEVETCEAKPLIHDTLLLDLDDDPETPAEAVELFSSEVTSTKNPARIFYVTTEIPKDTLTAFNVTGTVVIPPTYPLDTVFVHGSIYIEPSNVSEHPLPALISAKDLDISLRGDLAEMSESIAGNHIQGLVYVQGDITISSLTSGEIITGSLFGRNITMSGNPVSPMHISYDPRILSAPPPGFDLIEPGAWREPFSE